MDEFDAQWFRPRRVKTKKRKARLNPSSLAGGIEEIPEMLGKKRLAAEDRPMEERMTREQAENLAQKLETWLVPYVEFAEVCGSYRRGREDPGDLDVVVILKNRVKLPEVVEMWLAEGKASAVNWVGEKKTQMVIDGVKVDIRTTTPRAKGAALLYFTGPAGYNIGIRSAAKRAGFKLSEYGLFNRETNEYIAGATEEDIYAALGRNYRAPTERRAEEKISLAQRLNRERPKPKGQDYSLLTQEQLTGIGGYFFNTKEKRQAFIDRQKRKKARESEKQNQTGFGWIGRAESFKPPASAVSNAKRGLELRKKWGRGGLSPSEAKSHGIDSGVTRARKISSGKVSQHDVRRMSAFNRHRKNYRPEKKMPDGGPTAGTIAWLLWGGTSGVNWAKKKSAAMNAEEVEDYPDWDPEEFGIKNEEEVFDAELVMSRFSPEGYSLYGRKLHLYGRLQGAIVGGQKGVRNNPEKTYTGRYGVRWGSFTEGTPERAIFDKVSQEMKPESFEQWMDVIYATNDRLKEPQKKKSRFGRKKKAETFEAVVLHQGKLPEGAVAKAMLTHAMMEKAKMLETIAQLENSISLGLISEEEVMRSLKDKFGAETQDFAPRYEIQIRTSRGNVTERIPVSAGMLVRRVREILARKGYLYAMDIFGTEPAFNFQGPYGMQVYRPKPKLMAVYKYGKFESGEMADHLNEKLGLR
jgi:hypothetical protein